VASTGKMFPECGICLEVLDGSQQTPAGPAVTTRCGHLYHKNCISTWFDEPPYPSMCPTCRCYVSKYHLITVYLNISHDGIPTPDDVAKWRQTLKLRELDIEKLKLMRERLSQMQRELQRLQTVQRQLSEKEFKLGTLKRELAARIDNAAKAKTLKVELINKAKTCEQLKEKLRNEKKDKSETVKEMKRKLTRVEGEKLRLERQLKRSEEEARIARGKSVIRRESPRNSTQAGRDSAAVPSRGCPSLQQRSTRATGAIPKVRSSRIM